jgi:hypothetical protein
MTVALLASNPSKRMTKWRIVVEGDYKLQTGLRALKDERMGITIRDTPRAHDGHIEHMPPGTLFKIDDGLPTTIWMKLGKFLVPKIDIPQVMVNGLPEGDWDKAKVEQEVDVLDECAVNLSSGQVMAFRAHCHFLIIDAELVVHGEHRNLVVR